MKFRTKMGRWAAAVLLAAACMTVYPPVAYAAGDPTGPAADAGYGGPHPMGPGLQGQIKAEEHSGNRPVQEDRQEAGNTEQTQQSQEDQQEAGNTEQTQQSQEGQQEAGNTEQTQQSQEGQQEAGNAEQTQQPENKDGLVLSGGRYIDPSKPMIALTFDDGPYAPVGNQIMDCLEKYNGRSTFFVVGNRVPSYKSEVRRMHDDGHEVGNHTYEHKYLTKLNAEEVRSQIDRCNQAVAAVTKEPPRLVRLPGGMKNETVMENVKLPIIMWDIDTQDWKTRNTRKTIDAVLGKVHDGDVVLMHELYQSTGEAVETIVPVLVKEGYQLVTVSELASFRGGAKEGSLYYKFRP